MNIPPQNLRKGLWVFPSNISSHGGTSWCLEFGDELVLIDCPAIIEQNIDFLRTLGTGKQSRIILTSREGHGNIRELQSLLGWSVLVQEQEAYLLPDLPGLETFETEAETVSGLRLLWTPGPTPGSCVVYAPPPRNVLFCGRLLIPLNSNNLGIFRHRRTFHWARQQKSLENLLSWLPSDSFPSLASGASLLAVHPVKLFEWDSLKLLTE